MHGHLPFDELTQLGGRGRGSDIKELRTACPTNVPFKAWQEFELLVDACKDKGVSWLLVAAALRHPDLAEDCVDNML